MISPLKDIDWNEVWKAQMLLSLESSPGRDCARIWESKESALAFWNMCKNERSRIDQTVWETEITSATSVLDVGAGHPGHPLRQKSLRSSRQMECAVS